MPTVLLILALLLTSDADSASTSSERAPVDWVDPKIGTAHARWFFFASASRPFGLVSLAPDTRPTGDWDAGYVYGVEFVHGFSHIHGWQLAGIPLLPTVGSVQGHRGSRVYGSRFSHERESVRPGYHRMYLDDYDVTAELTSTNRVGFHRYTFPASQHSNILLDLGAELGPTRMAAIHAEAVSDSEIVGMVVNDRTMRRPKATPIYFVARFSKPFRQVGSWKQGLLNRRSSSVSGKDAGMFVSFHTDADEQILVKVSISYVSIGGARRNMAAELPHWDFDRIAGESRSEWNTWLSRIMVKGGTAAQRTRFYTDLWHALLGRHIVSDVDGKYADLTGSRPRIRQIPRDADGNPRYAHYNSDAFWGSQWSIGLLWSLAYPDVVSGFVNSMIDMYRTGGLIPRGPAGGNYTYVMTGATSTPFIVSAFMKGIRDFDVEEAYAGLRKNHQPGGMMSKAGYEHGTARGGGIHRYLRLGYVPEGRFAPAFHVEGAGQTLEYAYADWCLAQMAASLGRTRDAYHFMERAANYRNLFDTRANLMRPRRRDGQWVAPFDPSSKRGWIEGNARQYTWYVPHDIEGLIRLMGGRERFTTKLSTTLDAAEHHGFVAGHDSYSESVNYANQPNMHLAHLFAYAGAPWLTQEWVRRIHETVFSGTTPEDGYPDDEDQGQFGSLGVLMAIGLFDVQGGCGPEPTWQITTPLFDEITISLHPKYYAGSTFRIVASRPSEDERYIRTARINGKWLSSPLITHEQIAGGGELRLDLGREPDLTWGSWPQDAPPSMTSMAEELLAERN